MSNIIIERGKTVKLEELEEYSVAIDGFVIGPQIDALHHKFSFDHHGTEILRHATSSASFQSWVACMLGLEAERFNYFINHVDSDSALAVWTLKNSSRCSEPLVKKLVDAVNLSDCFGGALVFNGNSKLVEWVSAPEVEARRCGDYDKLSNEGLRNILDSILARIDLYVNGDASIEISKNHPHCEFKVLSNENDWVMVESDDSHVYSALYHSGFDRLVVVHQLADKSYCFSVAKRSDFIPNFDLFEIFSQLNKLEPGWGGGSTIGGAPRNPDGSRSRLTPDQVREIVNNCVLGKYKIKPTRKKAVKK